MVTRDEFLELLWKDVIGSPAGEYALENIIANCKRNPDGPFGDVGAAIERLLAALIHEVGFVGAASSVV